MITPNIHEDPIRTASDVHRIERIPLKARGLPGTTYEALKRGAAIDPSAIALSFFFSAQALHQPFELTHQSLIEKITQTANAFRRLGIERDDVVAVLLPNLPETHYAIWGGSAAGRVLAINPLLEACQIRELLNTAQAKIIVTMEKTPATNIWEKVEVAIENVPSVEHILVCNFFPYLDTISAFGLSPIDPPLAVDLSHRSIRVTRLLDEIATEPKTSLTFPPPKPGDISTMLGTGGTTGLPKIVPRTHAAEVYNSWAASRFAPMAFAPGKTALCGLPMFHTNGMLITGLLPLMLGGHVVVAGPAGFRAEDVLIHFWRMIETYQVSTFSAVPSVYAKLLELPHEELDTSSVCFAICGGAPMPMELLSRFREETGINLVEAYGMTEGVVGSAMNPPHSEEKHLGSIGLRLPYQDMAIGITDPDGEFLRWAKPNQAGCVFISGPNVFSGYLLAEQNNGIWLDEDGKRWFNTGDIARQDEEGFFWLIGRQKDLIIRYGDNLDPRAIERAVCLHPDVDIAAAIGRPHPVAGEVPVVFYQARAETRPRDEDLEALVYRKVGDPAAFPIEYIRLDTMPINAIGKIDRIQLHRLEIEGTIRAESARVGAKVKALQFRQDALRGLVATVDVLDKQREIKARLANYSFAVDFDTLPHPESVLDPLAHLINQ